MLITVLTFHNPITNEEDKLNIEDINTDYFTWTHNKICNTDEDIIKELDELLKDLNCDRIYNNIPVIMPNYIIYDNKISKFYSYLLKLSISKYKLFNEYINKLIELHINNLIIYNDYIIRSKVVKTKTTKPKKTKKKIKNVYLKRTTKDLFTNKNHYFYENPNTGDSIESDNPNLLDKLNKSKSKVIGVSMKAMTFSFKKKK